MMEFFSEYGLFLAKTLTLVVAILVVVGMTVLLTHKPKSRKGEIEITDLSEQLADSTEQLTLGMLDEDQAKQWKKDKKKAEKAEKKAKKSAKDEEPGPRKPRLFVLNFKGGIEA